MKILIKGFNLPLTDALKVYATEKISGLGRFSDRILTARIELVQSAHHQKGFLQCVVNLDMADMPVIRAESIGPDLYASIDAVVPKLREQIEKHKGQVHEKDRKLRRYLKTFAAWRPWRR